MSRPTKPSVSSPDRAPALIPPQPAYDPLSPEVLANPWPAYAALREHCPVHHYADFEPPFYTLSRYADVREALGNAEAFSIRYGQSPQYTRPAGLVNDPPEHTPFRQMFNRAFTPRVIARLGERVRGLANELLDALVPAGRADFQPAYASPLPTTLIAELLGIPARDHRLFRSMSDDLTATYNEPDPAVSGPPRKAFDRYFQAVLDQRRAALAQHGVDEAGPEHLGSVIPDDLISRFVVGRIGDRPAEDRELHYMLLLLLLGGNETSTALLTNLLWRLLEAPERWEAVKANPELIDAAVEESLRFDSPVLGLFRTPSRDLRLYGVTLPAKAKVMLLFASANRDPEVFDRPDEFRLDRDPEEIRRKLLTFGFGAHYCPGAALARLEARVTLELLLERMPDLRLAGEPTRIVPFNLWGRASLPLAW
jgi:cytochrome P450